MKTVYCISGLGADEKVFSRMRLDGYSFVCLPWLQPQKNETIESYAARMGEGIEQEDAVIIGLSFGGMMAIEIAKQKRGTKVILLSSIKSFDEMPRWMRLAGKLRLNRMIPMRPYKVLQPFQNIFIGATSEAEKKMVMEYRKNVSHEYLGWAVDVILNWRNNWQPETLYHIHGTADRIFPPRKVNPTHMIKGGTHLMIMGRAGEVNRAVNEILEKIA